MEKIDEQISEMTEQLSKDTLPVFYKYRYTFDNEMDDLHSQKLKVKLMVKAIQDKFALDDKLTAGIEYFTKGLLTTRPHVHIHFVSKYKADYIRKYLMRHFEMKGRCQACMPEVLVDESKFWRYPLKQQKGETKRYHITSGFDKQVVEHMIDVANSCWKQSAEVLVGRLEKKLAKTSRERLYAYFDSLSYFSDDNKDCITLRQSCIEGYKYYAEHEDNVCVKTIDGYVNQYLLSKNFISYDKFYELTH